MNIFFHVFNGVKVSEETQEMACSLKWKWQRHNACDFMTSFYKRLWTFVYLAGWTSSNNAVYYLCTDTSTRRHANLAHGSVWRGAMWKPSNAAQGRVILQSTTWQQKKHTYTDDRDNAIDRRMRHLVFMLHQRRF